MSEIIYDKVELRRRGFDVLRRELGYVNAIRFLGEYEPGRGDYAKDRWEFLPDWSAERWAEDANQLAARQSEA